MNLWGGKYQRSYIKWCRQGKTVVHPIIKPRQRKRICVDNKIQIALRVSVTDKTLLVDEAEQPALSFKYVFF